VHFGRGENFAALHHEGKRKKGVSLIHPVGRGKDFATSSTGRKSKGKEKSKLSLKRSTKSKKRLLSLYMCGGESRSRKPWRGKNKKADLVRPSLVGGIDDRREAKEPPTAGEEGGTFG